MCGALHALRVALLGLGLGLGKELGLGSGGKRWLRHPWEGHTCTPKALPPAPSPPLQRTANLRERPSLMTF